MRSFPSRLSKIHGTSHARRCQFRPTRLASMDSSVEVIVPFFSMIQYSAKESKFSFVLITLYKKYIVFSIERQHEQKGRKINKMQV